MSFGSAERGRTAASSAAGRRANEVAALPPELDRRFEALVFDWECTAVAGPGRDASALRSLIGEACALGLELGVVTRMGADDVDRYVRARPQGPGRLHVCANGGSEVFVADEKGPRRVDAREATPEEDASLDAAAEAVVAALARRGLSAAIVAGGPNRRRIDLVHESGWEDLAETQNGSLLEAVEERLRAAGLAGVREALLLAHEAAKEAGLADPRVTKDGTHVEIGLTDTSDSVRWLFSELGRRGVAPGLVLVAGGDVAPLAGPPGSDSLLLVPEAARATAVSAAAEPVRTPAGVLALGGGPDCFLDLLADQVERRRRGDVPQLDGDSRWTIAVDGFEPALERVHESLLTLADGRLGTRGAPLFSDPASEPSVLAAAVYEGEGSATELARCPEWAVLRGRLPSEPPLRRQLDLRTGVLRQDGSAAAVALSSLARPGTVVMRAQADARRLPRAGREILPGPGVVAAVRDARVDGGLERIRAYRAGEREAVTALAEAENAGFETLFSEHRAAWAARWEEADVVIDGDPELQRAVRFALFHLMASVATHGEAAVGARGLSGPAYRGHVFWDSDVFVLPFLAATYPAAARAMLEYRVRRLPQAREIARRGGWTGARFPWESAVSGYDVTPATVRFPTGEVTRIRTGEREEHIVADVAWAACCYLDWTGDDVFAAGPGRDLLVETARYWASRVRLDSDGRGHIYGVIGPDEYHEPVDDNAYTNVMARWNLRRAAELDVEPNERAAWRRVADALVDGYDRMSGLYEQFAGFFGLEPLVIADVAPRRPLGAEVFLGLERTRSAQVVKQADVLMLHHLVPDEVAPGSLSANLDFYEPRTAHGSSLSPAVHAGLHARAGRFREALGALRIAARMDLDDLTGSTAGGLHLATMGGLWQALAFGFAGVRPRGDSLVVDPRLPPDWAALELGLRFRQAPLRLRIDRRGVELETTGDLALTRRDHVWEVVAR